MSSAYPEGPIVRDRWIRKRRGPRNALDPTRPYSAFVEEEIDEAGEIRKVATIFLTNRECPWRCLMCDLWKNTLTSDTAPGAVPRQVRRALRDLPPAARVKLYNAGSFFDPGAIPPEDDDAIVELLAPFDRVVVESHPALVGSRCEDLQGKLGGRLEVAMGLETIHPEVLPRLNKRMTTSQYRAAAGFLSARGIAHRSFVLVGLPWVGEAESLEWAVRSADFAFASGAGAVSLIPTRTGNGAMEALESRGEFTPPTLGLLEAAAAGALALGAGRVFADLWDLEWLAGCASCFDARRLRLIEMNRAQRVPAPVPCVSCGGGN